MKRLILILVMTLSLAVAGFGATAHAVDPLDEVCAKTPNASVCKDNHANGTNPIFGADGVLTKIMGWLARIVGVAAVLVIIIAGLMMTFAGDNAEQAATAKRAITYSAIGLVVAAFAQGIVSFVLSKL